jgi:hypothetical protein
LVVVQHDDIDAALPEPGYRVHGGRTAINGQEQGNREPLETMLDRLKAQAIPLVQPVRQVIIHGPTKASQHLGQQSRRGHPIDVVITEDDQRFAALAGAKEPFDRRSHVGQQERIGQLLQARLEKTANALRIVQSAIQKALRHQRRNLVPIR